MDVGALEDLALEGEGDVLEGHLEGGLGEGVLDEAGEGGAAGDFHVDDGEGSQLGGAEDGDEFFEVGVGVIEFWAGDGELAVGEELVVEVAQGEGGAVGGEEEVGVLEAGRGGGEQV